MRAAPCQTITEGQEPWLSFFLRSNLSYIVTGMSDTEAKIARIMAISFGSLWLVMLGLNMLSGM
jgi:hypothetical protein